MRQIRTCIAWQDFEMPEKEDLRKHLDLVQGVVNRLAGNSFSVKAWAVGLIAILGALAAKDADPRMACALILPTVCFWGLDAYYLQRERLYRKLYEAVVNAAMNQHTVVPLYSLDTSSLESDADSILAVARSSTILWLHLPILLFVAGLIVWSWFKHATLT